MGYDSTSAVRLRRASHCLQAEPPPKYTNKSSKRSLKRHQYLAPDQSGFNGTSFGSLHHFVLRQCPNVAVVSWNTQVRKLLSHIYIRPLMHTLKVEPRKSYKVTLCNRIRKKPQKFMLGDILQCWTASWIRVRPTQQHLKTLQLLLLFL